MTRAVVLLSGGLDSATVLAKAVRDGKECIALSFDYAQRHAKELDHAKRIADRLGVRHLVLPLPLGQLGGSSLTDSNLNVPTAGDDIGTSIPSTYVPARNTIFLSFAMAVAEVEGADEIHVGVNALDYSGYPDCRPEYLEAVQRVFHLATKQGIETGKPTLVAPLVELDKKGIVRLGKSVGSPLALTWSCYRGSGVSCGTCESCVLRLRGFQQAGLRDPIEYDTTDRPDSDLPLYEPDA